MISEMHISFVAWDRRYLVELIQCLYSSREQTDTETKHCQEEEAAHTGSDDDSSTKDVIGSQSALHILVQSSQRVRRTFSWVATVVVTLFDGA